MKEQLKKLKIDGLPWRRYKGALVLEFWNEKIVCFLEGGKPFFQHYHLSQPRTIKDQGRHGKFKELFRYARARFS